MTAVRPWILYVGSGISAVGWILEAIRWCRTRCASSRCWADGNWTCDSCGKAVCLACLHGLPDVADYCPPCAPTAEQFWSLWAAVATAQRQLPKGKP